MSGVVSVVSNDIVTDNRVHKIAQTLQQNGYDVKLVGRRQKSSLEITARPYCIKRFRLLFNKGPLFYLNLNIRIFLFLLRSNEKIVISNDLDTLPGCALAAKIKGMKLVFDSHELFPEVPELLHRPFIRSIWTKLEKVFLPRIDAGITVCGSIAEFYKSKYGIDFEVVRNAGKYRPDNELKRNKSHNNRQVILYQGALNVGRGIELAIQSMQYVNNAELWIIGTGDIEESLKILSRQLGLENKVRFIGRISIEELWAYTELARLGLSLEENLGLNYRFALPNKLFDYIQARIPVIVSDLPEMAGVVNTYKIGNILSERTPKVLASVIENMIAIQVSGNGLQPNLELAAQELCWEKEEIKLISLFKQLCEPSTGIICE